MFGGKQTSQVRSMGPPLGLLGALKGTYGVYSRYRRIPGLRAHTRGPWFQPFETRKPRHAKVPKCTHTVLGSGLGQV